MTEAEWMASDNAAGMLAWSGCGPRPSDRKLRLFACACCRSVWHLLADEQSRKAVEVAERFADGGVVAEELRAAFDAAHQAANDANAGYFTPAWLGFYASDNRPEHAQESLRNLLFAATSLQVGQTRGQQAALLRDIVGNPWKPVTLPKGSPRKCPRCEGDGWVATPDGLYASRAACKVCGSKGVLDLFGPCPWLTRTVLSLAQAAYQERRRKCGECKGAWPRKCSWCGSDKPCSSLDCRQPRYCHTCNCTGTIDDGTLDNARLAVLSDALEEAGCPAGANCVCRGVGVLCFTAGPADPDDYRPCQGCALITHLRSPGPHYRGCWAVDLLLGKG